MIGISVTTLAIIVLLIITMAKPRDIILDGVEILYVLVGLASLPIMLIGGLHLLFAFGEGGQGLPHLAVGLPLIVTLFLIWRQPRWSAILLTVAGFAVYVENAITPPQGNPHALNPALPILAPGLLLLIAVILARVVKYKQRHHKLV